MTWQEVFKMVVKEKVFQYPETIKADFLKSGGLKFSDGSEVSAEEIWRFLTEEAPRRFPHAFDASANSIGKLSEDVQFLAGIKRAYLTLTMKDRLFKAHDNGVPIVMIQGGQTLDPYYAAGGIPLRPGYVMQWARDIQEGLNLRETDAAGLEILEKGRRKISIEACNQVAAHAAVANNIVPVDLIAPYLCLRCSDMSFLVETHRYKEDQRPKYLVDFPINQTGKRYTVDYVAEQLRGLVKEIAKLSKKEVTDETLRREIRRQNKARRLAQEIIELWWSAEQPPLNSTDFFSIPFLANDFVGDPEATIQVLEETKKEVAYRIEHKIKGAGVADQAKRVFVCGSCVGPNATSVERAGAVLVGRDDNFSCNSVLVKEDGDPYRNLAEAILAFPYELPTEQRAAWTAEMVKKSRADGVLFMYNWGCNYQTSVGRMISDIVKAKTGKPSTFVEVGELGRTEATEQSENRVEAFIEMI
jgi:benzoyl-CoA reductase/2-hydroxyglutaryl-CoA dehydratase subunit BcrC/BadD/HgdB